MNKFESVTKSLRWFVALLLVVFAAGCGSSSSTTSPLSSAKVLTSFTVAGAVGTVVGTIDEPAKTVALTVPYGTNVTALVATFSTTGASVKVGTTVQNSATTANDFSGPVTYTVTAADGTTAAYAVTVSLTSATAKAITAYSFAAYPSALVMIDEAAKTIAVTVPYGTNVTALVATFTITGASVSVASVAQISGTTPNNFTTSKAYVVTAGDSSTATYTVTVIAASNTAKAITSFSFNGFPGAPVTINEAAKTIAVTLPYNTPVTALISTFVSTGTSVTVGTPAVTQVSGPSGTANNFTSPVAYTVHAADATTATYTVTVTVVANSAKAISAFSFAAFPSATATITGSASPYAIAVTLPAGTTVTGLIATFTTDGSSVTVGATTQVSTTTANDFTSTVAYTVHAADASTAIYNVTVTLSTSVLPGAGANPTVLSSSPTNGDIFVPTSSNSKIAGGANNTVTGKLVTATFSEAMTAGTITPVGTFTLYDNTAASGVSGTVTMNIADTMGHAANMVATFTPTNALAFAHNYTATITTAAQAVAGNTPISNTVAWSFTTNASALTGQEPVDLLSISRNNFVILAETQITDAVPASGTITGNIGLATATGAGNISVTCPEMQGGGLIHESDAGMTDACFVQSSAVIPQAALDRGTAYTDAAGRTNPAVAALAADISGQTLSPGIYSQAGAVLIYAVGTNADPLGVTLDCHGDTNAVFVFQIGGTLTLGQAATPAEISLIGGCQAKNVFWKVTSDVTIEPSSVFRGNILTATLVAMKLNAVLHGRALAATAVTLIGNAVGP